jgi:hypothetical protein
MNDDTDYKTYRGKCQEFVKKAIEEDPTLVAVRGYYYDTVWGRQAHWWCKREDGTIYDPTAMQFPSKGTGVYDEFGGKVECEVCGKEMLESEAEIAGNGHYAVCSTACYRSLVGV